MRYAREARVLRIGRKDARHQLSTDLSRSPLEGCELQLWVAEVLGGVLRWLLHMLLWVLLLLLLWMLQLWLLRRRRLLLQLLLLVQSLLYGSQSRPLPLDLLGHLMQ